MMLPHISHASIDKTGEANRLEGYLADSYGQPVRINFVLRPDIGYVYFVTFIGYNVVDSRFVDYFGHGEVRVSHRPIV